MYKITYKYEKKLFVLSVLVINVSKRMKCMQLKMNDMELKPEYLNQDEVEVFH